MQQLGDVELRVTDTTANETAVRGLSPPQKGVPISVERTSQAYQDLLAELTQQPQVGRSKGVEDRLAARAGMDPAKLGAELPKVKPDGFDVTIQGRTITVVPRPRRK